MKRLRLTVVMLLVGIVLLGCGKESLTQEEMQAGVDEAERVMAEMDEKYGGSGSSSSVRDLKVSNLSQNYRGSIHHVTGEITNDASSAIDDLIEMVIFNEDGDLIKIQNVKVELSPGETMFFEEIVGQDEAGHSVQLQEF